MNRPGQPRRAAPRSTLFAPLISVNAGILVALVFGPNGMHPNLAVAAAGVVVTLLGVAAGVRALLVQRRTEVGRER